MTIIFEYLKNWETVICVVYGDPRHTPASFCCISPCNHLHRYSTAIRRDQIYLTVHKLAFTYVLSMVSRGVCLQVFVVYLFATMSTVIAPQARQPRYITVHKPLLAHVLSMVIRGVRLQVCVVTESPRCVTFHMCGVCISSRSNSLRLHDSAVDFLVSVPIYRCSALRVPVSAYERC